MSTTLDRNVTQDCFPWYVVRYLDDGAMRVVSMHTSDHHAHRKLAKCSAHEPGRRFAVLASRSYREARELARSARKAVCL